MPALQVWRRPLPQVLREYVMDPIGASNTWRWDGYENSWVNVDGQMVQSSGSRGRPRAKDPGGCARPLTVFVQAQPLAGE
ncbi:MAG TPA: hypothetical protein VNL96_05735 [Gemmatimonadaceae bacterium]|nr:hypothetical protein [Gemmatimonadaceae bacterium]